jgi:hypothetical protein
VTSVVYPYLDYPDYYYSVAGGLVGGKDGRVYECFWDTEVSGQSAGIAPGPVGKTTSEMKTLSTFTYAGWNFVGREWPGTSGIWYMRSGDYPRLIWQNHSPAANAGVDHNAYVWTQTKTEVVLDGSGSSDRDGDSLTYKWTWEIDGTVYESNSINPTIELPIGVHTIRLVVNDGLADSGPDDVNVAVVVPMKGTLEITPQVINRISRQPRIEAVIQLPEGITSADVDDNQPLVMYLSDDLDNPLFVQVADKNGSKIRAWFSKDELMAATSAGDIELTVAGKLKSGQWFYGCHTIRVIGHEAQSKTRILPLERLVSSPYNKLPK